LPSHFQLLVANLVGNPVWAFLLRERAHQLLRLNITLQNLADCLHISSCLSPTLLATLFGPFFHMKERIHFKIKHYTPLRCSLPSHFQLLVANLVGNPV